MKHPSRELSLKDLVKSGSFFTHLLSFFEELPCASYFLIDLFNNKLLHASSALLNITGYSLDRLKEDGSELFLANVHPDDKPRIRQLFSHQKSQYLSNRQTENSEICKFPLRLKLEDGALAYFEVYTSIFTLEDRNTPIMIGMVRDITEAHCKSAYLLDVLSGYIEGEAMDSVKKRLGEIENRSEEKHIREVTESFNRYKWIKEKLNQLSDREKQVLRLIAEGFSSKELAERLNISSHTATSHRKNLLTKFKARNTAELIKEAGKVLSFN